MKTTVEINDALLREAKKTAAQRRQTLKALIESALRQHLKGPGRPRPGTFKLRKHPFRGRGLQPDVAEGDWSEIRRRAYEGRGG